MKYVNRIRIKPKSLLLYNSWYDIRSPEMSNEEFIDCFHFFKENLIEKYRVCLDAFVLDDGWQDRNSIWKIDQTKFSDGFTPLVNELATGGCKLGLWLSLPGVGLNINWGREKGYEASNKKLRLGSYYCLSEPKYYQMMKNTLEFLIKEYDIAYFKHDFNYFECTAEEHGHLPEKGHGLEANIDAEIDLLKFERSLNPDIEPHSVTLRLDNSIGMEKLEEEFLVNTSYPEHKSLGQHKYGSIVDLEILDCETLILEIGSVKTLLIRE